MLINALFTAPKIDKAACFLFHGVYGHNQCVEVVVLNSIKWIGKLYFFLKRVQLHPKSNFHECIHRESKHDFVEINDLSPICCFIKDMPIHHINVIDKDTKTYLHYDEACKYWVGKFKVCVNESVVDGSYPVNSVWKFLTWNIWEAVLLCKRQPSPSALKMPSPKKSWNTSLKRSVLL